MQSEVQILRYKISIILIWCCFFFTGTHCFARAPELTIPFQVINNFIIINLKVNGSPEMKFIYDSGSEHSLFFDKDVATVFQISTGRPIRVFGSDLSKPIDAFIGKAVNFESTENQTVQADIIILDENIFHLDEYSGLPISGIIGNSFFRNKILEIDYDGLKLKIYSQNQINPIKAGFKEIASHWLKGKPYLKATIHFNSNTNKEGDILFDSGASVGLLLYKNYLDTSMIPHKLIPGSIGMGLGGPIEGFLGRIHRLEMDWVEEQNVITNFQQLDSATLENDQSKKLGIVGNSLISKYNVFLDFSSQKIYLKKNRFGKRTPHIDRSGLFIIASGVNLNEFTIKEIIVNSPAMKVGLLPGDRIIRINGFSGRNYTLGELNRKFSRTGRKKVTLTVLRAGKKHKYTFWLKDII